MPWIECERVGKARYDLCMEMDTIIRTELVANILNKNNCHFQHAKCFAGDCLFWWRHPFQGLPSLIARICVPSRLNGWKVLPV